MLLLCVSKFYIEKQTKWHVRPAKTQIILGGCILGKLNGPVRLHNTFLKKGLHIYIFKYIIVKLNLLAGNITSVSILIELDQRVKCHKNTNYSPGQNRIKMLVFFKMWNYFLIDMSPNISP